MNGKFYHYDVVIFVCTCTLCADLRVYSVYYLYLQISALISHRERLVKSERISLALSRVGQDVCEAVQKFVHIGENIASENVEIKQDMYEACREAREAGKCCVIDWQSRSTSRA